MTVLHYDDDASRQLLAIYETPDVEAQRAAFVRALAPRPAERVLDIGADPHLPRSLARRLERAGLAVHAAQVLPLFNPEFADYTYGNRLIDLLAAFASAHGRLSADETEQRAASLRAAGSDGDWFFSLNRYLFVAGRL